MNGDEQLPVTGPRRLNQDQAFVQLRWPVRPRPEGRGNGSHPA